MSTPTFELDRSPAAFIATLEVDSPMMQAPEPRWLWSCLRRRRAHWRFRAYRESFLAIRAFSGTNMPYSGLLVSAAIMDDVIRAHALLWNMRT
jgi:hypothetical protein